MTDTAPGVGFDVAAHFDLLGRVGDALDALKGEQAKANRLQQLQLQAGMLSPAAQVVLGSAACPTPTASFAFQVGEGPAQGRVWDLRRLVVGGLTYATAAAGAAYAFITASAAQQFATFSLAEWTDEATTMPLNSFYGAGEMTLRFPEKIVIVITGGTQGQQYMAAARVVDRMDSPTTRNTESVGT